MQHDRKADCRRRFKRREDVKRLEQFKSRNNYEAGVRSELENACGEKIVVKEFSDGYLLIRTTYPDDVVIIEEGFKNAAVFLKTVKSAPQVRELEKHELKDPELEVRELKRNKFKVRKLKVREVEGNLVKRLPAEFKMASFLSSSQAGLFTGSIPSSSPASSVELVVPFDALAGQYPQLQAQLDEHLAYLVAAQTPASIKLKSENQQRSDEYVGYLRSYFEMAKEQLSGPVSEDKLQAAMGSLAAQYPKFVRCEAELGVQKSAFNTLYPLGAQRDFVDFAHKLFMAAASIADPSEQAQLAP